MKFKPLDIEEEPKGLKRLARKKHTLRTVIFVFIGALLGFLYFYITEGQHMDPLIPGDIVKSMLIGGFFGFFITNSPCARNRC